MSAHLGDERVQAIDRLGPPRLEEVDRGVFAYIQPDGTWWINNTGFVTGTDGVIAVDLQALARLMALTGPVQAPNVGELNSENLVKILAGSYDEYDTVEQRNEVWDAEDARWKGEDTT